MWLSLMKDHTSASGVLDDLGHLVAHGLLKLPAGFADVLRSSHLHEFQFLFVRMSAMTVVTRSPRTAIGRERPL
jgi:hypothetical protein